MPRAGNSVMVAKSSEKLSPAQIFKGLTFASLREDRAKQSLGAPA